MSDIIRYAAEYSGRVPAVYVTLNPVKRDLPARARNRVKTYVKTATSDADIIKRRWLPIDVDLVRPKDISATDAEHEMALNRTKEIRAFLRSQGWPDSVLADSGNGGHLIPRIDLSNDNESTELLRRCLESLDFVFSDEKVKVDTGIFNASRIWKLYGTTACKGDNIPERPHRLARLLEVPSEITIVSQELLQNLAAMLPETPKSENKAGSFYKPIEIENWITGHGLTVRRTKPWQGAMVYELSECPFNSEHNSGEARIIQFPNVALSFGCFHNSCQGNDWHTLREKLEPGWRERKSSNGFDRSNSRESSDFSNASVEEENHKKTNQADRLVALVEKLPVTLFHDEYGDPYTRFKRGDHFEIWKIRSKQFKRWISHEFWNAKEKVPNSDSLNSALNVIEAKACFEGNKHQLHNRVAWHEGAIWLTLETGRR